MKTLAITATLKAAPKHESTLQYNYYIPTEKTYEGHENWLNKI